MIDKERPTVMAATLAKAGPAGRTGRLWAECFDGARAGWPACCGDCGAGYDVDGGGWPVTATANTCDDCGGYVADVEMPVGGDPGSLLAQPVEGAERPVGTRREARAGVVGGPGPAPQAETLNEEVA